MKKYIISTLASAVIVPGTGQVINQQFKKGLALMGIVFIIFIGFIISMYKMINNMASGLAPEDFDARVIVIEIMGSGTVKIFLSALFVIWAYSVIDAFLVGLRIEKQGKNIS